MKNVLVVGLLALCAGCVSSSDYNVSMESGQVKIVREIGLKAMREAIFTGAAKRNWFVEKESDGCVTLQLQIRGGKHQVRVNVEYTADSFTVKYLDSVNLDYDPETGTIRGKYIQWVRNLKQDIRLEASKIR